MSTRLIVDSACDIPEEEAKKKNIVVLPLQIAFGEDNYLDGVTLSKKEFYEKLKSSDSLPHTAQVSPYAFQEAFEEAKKAGDDVLCLTIFSKLSGCFQSATMIAKDYPNVTLVDSLNVSIGELVLVELASSLLEEGKSAKEAASILEEKKKDVRVYGLLDTVEYLRKGGRISGAAALMGNLMAVKPIIGVDDGLIKMKWKTIGSKLGMKRLSEVVKLHGGIDLSSPIVLGYSGEGNPLFAKFLAGYESLWKGSKETPLQAEIGATVGTHIGPGAIGIAYFEAKKK